MDMMVCTPSSVIKRGVAVTGSLEGLITGSSELSVGALVVRGSWW